MDNFEDAYKQIKTKQKTERQGRILLLRQNKHGEHSTQYSQRQPLSKQNNYQSVPNQIFDKYENKAMKKRNVSIDQKSQSNRNDPFPVKKLPFTGLFGSKQSIQDSYKHPYYRAQTALSTEHARRSQSTINQENSFIHTQSELPEDIAFLKKRITESISAFEKFKHSYKQNQIKRIEKVKGKLNVEKATERVERELTNEEKVQQEIKLLKKVREVTTNSYKNRIKTGGSLVDFSHLNQNPISNDYRENTVEDIQSEHQKETKEQEDNEVVPLKKYFKHHPKYPLKTQSIRNTLSRTNMRKNSLSSHSSQQMRSISQVSIKINSNNKNKRNLLNAKQSLEDQEFQKIEKLKSMVYSLPIILAKNPQINGSIDHLYFKGCKRIYEHDYEKALKHFSIDFSEEISQLLREMFIFNKGFCQFKLENYDQALTEFKIIKYYEFDVLAKFNASIIHLLSNQVYESFQYLEFCMQQLMQNIVQIEWINRDEFIKNCKWVLKILKEKIILSKRKNIVQESDDEDNLDQQRINQCFEQYDKFFEENNQKNLESLKSSPTAPYKSQSILRYPNNQNNQNEDKSSDAPSIKNSVDIQKSSQSIISDNQNQSDDGSNHNKKSKKHLNSESLIEQAYSVNQDCEYFPMPFHSNNQSCQEKHRHRIQSQRKKKQKYSQVLKDPYKQQTSDSMDQVSQMASTDLDKLVYKDFNNINLSQQYLSSCQNQQSNKSLIHLNFSQIKEIRENQLKEQATEKQHREQDDTKEMKSKITDEIEYDPSKDIEINEQGFYVVKPYYINGNENLMLDKIIGIKPDEEMTEEEAFIVERRRRIENDLIPPKIVLNKKEIKIGKEVVVDEETENFLMDNFLQIQERNPLLEEKDISPISKLRLIKQIRSGGNTYKNNNEKKPFKIEPKQREELQKGNETNKASLKGTLEVEDEEPTQVYKKRLRLWEMQQIQEYLESKHDDIDGTMYDKIDKYLTRLAFFAKYPYDIRKQLLGVCQLKIYSAGETIFRQGDSCPDFYVIMRGSTKAILSRQDYGNIPIVVSTFYDGKDFGEITQYEVSENLSPEMVKSLNTQKYTCETMEESYIISLEKEKSNKIIDQNLQATFEQRIQFLRQLDIFKNIDLHVLLPLANNLKILTYSLGEYILREGEEPKGLYILIKGQCKVGSEKLNMRAKQSFFGGLQNQLRNFRFNGNFSDSPREKQSNEFRIDTKESEDDCYRAQQLYGSQIEKNEKRMFQNDRIFFDDKGKEIKDHIVYKDFDYFGGKVLLVSNDNSHYFDDEDSTFDTKKAKKRIQYDNSLLSVIADSSEVQLLLMDRSQMSFFPEKVQKEIYHRVEEAFQPDQPYEKATVEKIKDKFKEWETYKLETVSSILKQSYAEKKKSQILNINR